MQVDVVALAAVCRDPVLAELGADAYVVHLEKRRTIIGDDLVEAVS